MTICNFSEEIFIKLEKGNVYWIIDPDGPAGVLVEKGGEKGEKWVKIEIEGDDCYLIKVDYGLPIAPGIQKCDFLLCSENWIGFVELKLNGREDILNLEKGVTQLISTGKLLLPFLLFGRRGSLNKRKELFFFIGFTKRENQIPISLETLKKKKRIIKSELERFLNQLSNGNNIEDLSLSFRLFYSSTEYLKGGTLKLEVLKK